MRSIAISIFAALVLDTIFGDPQWRYHPVRLIGGLATYFERITRGKIGKPKIAGAIAWLGVMGVTLVVVGAVLYAGHKGGTALYISISSVCIYFSIAPKDLAGHAANAARALDLRDIGLARERASRMVSRDTSSLSETGIIRAVVESTSENLVDGVTGALFFAVVFGPVGAVLFRAINTMDAMFGYKNHRYRDFGWFAARADDFAGFIPARLTGPLLCLTAPFGRGSISSAFCIMLRDRKLHSSPNGGIVESAAAGALGIQLGGPGIYNGVLVEKPCLGDPGRDPLIGDIRRTVYMMYSAAVLTAACLLLAEAGVRSLWEVLG